MKNTLVILTLLLTMLTFTACTSTPVADDSRNRPEAANRPTPVADDSRSGLVGAYGNERDLTEKDLGIFKVAVRNTKARDMIPFKVSSQVVAGMNYRFRCRARLDNTPNAPEAVYIVTVFKPLPYTKLPPRVTAIDCISY